MLGDGYLGFSHLSAQNALYIGDAIEVLHSFGGWQLHDNYFGAPGATDPVTGDINSVEFQWVFSFGQLFWYPNAFWGQGPDLIASVFGMYNHVSAPLNLSYNDITKLKDGRRAYVPAARLVRRRLPLPTTSTRTSARRTPSGSAAPSCRSSRWSHPGWCSGPTS